MPIGVSFVFAADFGDFSMENLDFLLNCRDSSFAIFLASLELQLGLIETCLESRDRVFQSGCWCRW